MVSPKPKNLVNIQVVRLNLLSQIHPFIMECQKFIKRLPKGLIKKTYPSWNDNQVNNYWWSGDINRETSTKFYSVDLFLF
jgi:hypothetical protein